MLFFKAVNNCFICSRFEFRIMNWKEFLKPTKGKILLFIIFAVFWSIFGLMDLFASCINPCFFVKGTCQTVILPPFTCPTPVQSINIVWYVLAALSYLINPTYLLPASIASNLGIFVLVVEDIIVYIWNYVLASIIVVTVNKFRKKKNE